jgi:hypothetical protein
MRLPAALVLVAAASSLAVSPAAAQVSQKAPRASLVQVLRGGKQALILDRVRGEYEVVRVGDSIHGLRVAEIEEDQIVLATPTPPERYFVLPLVEAAPAPGAPKAGAVDPRAGEVDPRTGEAGPDPGVREDAPPAGAPASPGPASPDPASPAPPDAVSPDRTSPDRGSPDAPPPGDRSGPADRAGPADAPPDDDVLDPYGTPGDVGGDGSQAPVDPYADPYGPVGSGLPSVIAPPDSRAQPGPPAPDSARRPDQPAPAPSDRAPPRDPRDPRDPEFDADPSAAPPEDDLGDEGLDDELDDPDAEPIAPEPPADDSNVTKVKPTEVQPAAPPRARAKDDQVKDLSRRELDWALSDFAALSKQIRIERASGGGVRILDLERGSFVDKLGIKRGDVVKRVAGHSIDTVDEAAAAYAALESARDVVVELERRGAPLRLRYRLTK